MFFVLDIQFILNELESKEKLRKYFNISEVWSADQVYKTLSLLDSEKLMRALNWILNSWNCVKRRGKKTFSNYSNKDSTWEKYTNTHQKSVEKTVYLNVFLGALIISQGYYSKMAIQQLSEN